MLTLATFDIIHILQIWSKVMSDVVKFIFTLLILTAICITSVWADTDTITLHLRATVPPRVEITHDDRGLSVGINSEDVDVAAYDMDNNLISDYSNFGNHLRFVFTAL